MTELSDVPVPAGALHVTVIEFVGPWVISSLSFSSVHEIESPLRECTIIL
jgi:hypothetical protein